MPSPSDPAAPDTDAIRFPVAGVFEEYTRISPLVPAATRVAPSMTVPFTMPAAMMFADRFAAMMVPAAICCAVMVLAAICAEVIVPAAMLPAVIVLAEILSPVIAPAAMLAATMAPFPMEIPVSVPGISTSSAFQVTVVHPEVLVAGLVAVGVMMIWAVVFPLPGRTAWPVAVGVMVIRATGDAAADVVPRISAKLRANGPPLAIPVSPNEVTAAGPWLPQSAT